MTDVTLSPPRPATGTSHFAIRNSPGGRLLIVDDDPRLREVLVELLASEGYACLAAPDGEAALACLPADVSLVLTDLHMPGMGGIGLLRRVIADLADIAVIVISGNGDLPTAVEAMRLGAYDYVIKPFNPDDLALRVERALERRRLIIQDREHQRELERVVREQREELGLALDELRQTYQNTLEALAAALDLRDKETEGHSRRVTEYTTVLARALGMGGEALEVIRQGALLHDIGKIGIPDFILHKPTALTPDEWGLMRKHPQIGRDLLKDIGFLDEAVSTIVLRHQERYDGSGYPGGLMGDEIPLGARIFAVADTLDAITSDRVYRKARSFESARTEIRRHAGRQFDPQVVEAFASIPERTWHTIQNSVAILYSRM